ncbi:MAG: heme exporter protein CcmD [Gammaproteobacteria bacterium]|nr:heme exporter protein CcmD [Gammaproteobacteria bacterium]
MNNFSMGGYGYYVWSAYFITLFVFGINLFPIFFEKIKIKKIIREHLLKKRL